MSQILCVSSQRLSVGDKMTCDGKRGDEMKTMLFLWLTVLTGFGCSESKGGGEEAADSGFGPVNTDQVDANADLDADLDVDGDSDEEKDRDADTATDGDAETGSSTVPDAESDVAQLPDDSHLDGRDDVVHREGFEEDDWYAAWGLREAPQNTEIIRDGTSLTGDGHLRIRVVGGEHYGSSFGYDFADLGMDEPDEVYFRYALRLGPTWTTQDGGGGKLPGFGGTYGVAGWGGRPSHGTDGWSARGLFWQPDEGRTEGDTRIGYYCYHAEMTGTYGENWFWSGGEIGADGVIERDRWYQVETYVKLNTPEQNNGILKAWVDGYPVYEKTDILFRDVDTLHVERVWFDLYYGGTWTAPADMYIDFDAAVIAWDYIGPIGTK